MISKLLSTLKVQFLSISNETIETFINLKETIRMHISFWYLFIERSIQFAQCIKLENEYMHTACAQCAKRSKKGKFKSTFLLFRY